MCGIAGVVNFDNNAHISSGLIQKITQKIVHRGPDNIGVHVDQQFAFGHTRLSIIDLRESANQPMQDIMGEIVITYNGEIYNHLEIRQELESLGYQFNTFCDTEVILYAYKQWGVDCIRKFNGMFAFGLFDKRRNVFYLVRDRFGVKPVYYLYLENTFVFCSEIKGLLEFPSYKREINFKAVSDFLSFRQTIPPETLFKNIFLLQPASYLEMTQNARKNSVYWQLNSRQKRFVSKREKKSVKLLLDDAIRKTLISDVPIIAYLSGGIDSSVIVSAASKEIKIPTLTVDFQEGEYSERKYAEMVSSKLRVKNTVLKLSRDDYLSNISELIRYKDQPLGMHNEVALYLLARKAREQAKVALSGEGSDELFGGYGRIFRLPFEFFKSKIFDALSRKKCEYRTFFDCFINSYAYFPFEEKRNLFNENMKALIQEDQASLLQLRTLFEESPLKSFYSKIFHFFQRFHLHGLLTMMDSTSMSTGLEVRFPFVDHRLVEEVFSFPLKFKLKWNSLFAFFRALFKTPDEYSEEEDETKSLLKELHLSELPKEILYRKKMVFPVPLKEWLGGEFIEQTKQILFQEGAYISLILDLEKLKHWIEDKEKSKDPLYGRKIWLILNLELWLREYFPREAVN